MYGGAVVHKVDTVHGRRAMASQDERPRTYGTGRVRAVEGCSTVLSSYNPSALCCLHNRDWTVRPRPVERHTEGLTELIGTCQNPLCGAEFVTTNPAKKYCDSRCRMQAFQRRLTAERGRAATL
jgi:hypothetical protein